MTQKQNHSWIDEVEKIIGAVSFFLFPLIFFPVFSDIFGTTKLFFLTVVLGVLVFLKIIKIIVQRKISFYSSTFSSLLYLLLSVYGLSIVVASPNKVEALLDPNRGGLMVMLFVLLALLIHKDKKLILYAGIAGQFVLLLSLIISYFGLLKFLPSSWAFVNAAQFTATGSMLSTAILSGFFVGLALDALKKHFLKSDKHAVGKDSPRLAYFMLLVSVPLLALSIWNFRDSRLVFMPFDIAWQVAAEGIKNVKTLIFGVGPANYLSLYTVAKPLQVNSLDWLWQNNVEFSQSALLHIFSEIGLIGLAVFTLLFIRLFHMAKKYHTLVSFGVLLSSLLLFPLTYNFFFILFFTIVLFDEDHKEAEFDLTAVTPVVYVLAALMAFVLVGYGYLSYRAFGSENKLFLSYVLAREDKAQQVYDAQREATVLNPYSEKARINFGQTNMLLASNMAQKKELKDEDRQTIATLIQQSIAEAKAAITLNPNKASYWANLGQTYRQIITVAKGADGWTIAAHQRAVALDRVNPMYHFDLGTIYYGLGNYDQAAPFFEEAVSLRPQQANFLYNLAWTYYQRGDYSRASQAMQTVLKLVDEKSNDYKRAKKELNEFKSKLPKEQMQTLDGTDSETLRRTSPVPTVSPASIELPTDSKPPLQ